MHFCTRLEEKVGETNSLITDNTIRAGFKLSKDYTRCNGIFHGFASLFWDVVLYLVLKTIPVHFLMGSEKHLCSI